MNYSEWLHKNSKLLDSDYERLFIENVLANIKDFDFDSLKAQYPFRDSHGRQRFCDFVLQESDSVRIAFEVDGYDKRGTGRGMTRQEFVDWQRRQAALVALGWSVLRFANTDVRDQPQLCREHIELTLRHYREKSNHVRTLEGSIAHLKKELTQIQSRASGPTNTQKLTEQIRLLEQQLAYAKQTRPLDAQEQVRLAELDRAQDQINILKEESSVMKTTIWAFAFVLASVFVALLWKLPAGGHASTPALPPAQGSAGLDSTSASSLAAVPSVEAAPLNAHALAPEPAPMQAAVTAAKLAPTSSPQPEPSAASSERGTSCSNPIRWEEGKQRIGELLAVSGTVRKISEGINVPGKPIWIEIGETYPSNNRFTLVIWERRREAFKHLNLDSLQFKPICVLGKIRDYKGLPQIELYEPHQIYF